MDILHKIENFGFFEWIMTLMFGIMYILLIGLFAHGVFGLRTYIKIKSGAGIKGTMKYLTSEKHSGLQTTIIGGVPYTQPVNYINYYGKFYDDDNNIISDKAIINGPFDFNDTSPAVYYGKTIYTDGGKGNNIINWLLIVLMPIAMILISYFLWIIVINP